MFECPQSVNEAGNFKECKRKKEWGRFGDYELVGNGSITNPKKCGNFRGFVGCVNVDLHSIVKLDGTIYRGEVYVKKQYHSCDKPTCQSVLNLAGQRGRREILKVVLKKRRNALDR